MVDLTTPTPRSRTVQTEVTSLPILNRRCPNFSLMPSSFPSPCFPNIFNFLLRLWLLIFFNKFKPLLNLRTYCFSYFHQHLLLTLQSFTWEEHYLPFRSGPYLEFECNFRCSQMPLFWASGDNIGLKRAALVSKAAFAAVEHFE